MGYLGSMNPYPALFSPFDLGPLRLRNRIVCSPLTTNLGTDEGLSTARHLEFWRARARGGAGLVILDSAFPERRGKGFLSQVGCHSDETVPALRSIATVLRSEGAASALQIEHSGAQTTSLISGERPVAPSPVPDPRHGEMPHVLTGAEIASVIESFAQAARRIKEAGFDAVEIHGAHGYLVHQFLSPYFNHRGDEYGGDTLARTRFAREILARVRELVGADFPILFRISARDGLEGGLELEETLRICQILVEHGVDVLDVSAGVGATSHIMGPPAGTEQGPLVEFAHRVKQTVSVPVITVGRILDPSLAESIVATGRADLVAFGRALIADPDWPNKVRERRLAEVTTCVGCCGCNARSRRPDIICVVNSAVGLEDRPPLRPAESPSRVAVLGTGLGGLEAARAAAERGHEVRIWEPHAELGGLFGLRSRTPGRSEFHKAVTMSVAALKRLAVPIHEGANDWAGQIREWQPHHLIHAQAGCPRATIPGDLRCLPVVQAVDVLAGTRTPHRVVVLGAGVMGSETALHLARQGRKVSLLSLGSTIANDTHRSIQQHLLLDLAQAAVTTLHDVKTLTESAAGLTVLSSEGETVLHPDAIVLALGFEEAILPALPDLTSRVHPLGDAYGASDLAELVRAGFLLGNEL